MYGGAARSEDNKYNITRTATIIKRIDANWQEGTNKGGFPSGLTLSPDTWYHFFAIVKENSQVDAGYDSKLDASKLLADATDYKAYKRVGAVHTDGSSKIDEFVMFIDPSGRRAFYWKTIDGITPLPYPSGTMVVKTPLGISLECIINIKVESNFQYDLFLHNPDIGQPSLPLLILLTSGGRAAGEYKIYTNLESKISANITATNTPISADYTTIGWTE